MKETFLLNTENTKVIKFKMDIFGCKKKLLNVSGVRVYGTHCLTETQLIE